MIGTATGWTMKGAGCLNRSDKASLFWQDTSGSVVAWMPGLKSQIVNHQPVFTNLVISGATPWVLRGASDINGDGAAELLWQTPAGAAACWFMTTNGTASSIHSWGPVSGWRLCGGARKR